MRAKRTQLQFGSSNPSLRRRSSAVAMLLWVVFVIGLGMQGLTPGLKVENRAFVLPQSLIVQGKEIRPDSIVQRERAMQWTSGLCTLGSALALAFWYRRALAQALHLRRISG